MSRRLSDNACALLSAAAATTAPLLFGLCIGGAGPSKDTLKGSKQGSKGEKFTHNDANYKFEDFDTALYAALLSVGAMAGALMGGQLAERFGRKWTIVMMAPVYATAWLVTIFSQNSAMVHAGRVISGLAVGVNSAAAPVYIAEIAPDHLRGALGTCNQLMICLGILLAWVYGLNKMELEDESGNKHKVWLDWKLFNWLMFIPTTLMAVGMLLAPETPRWLASKGRLSEAKRVLDRIRGGKASRVEMDSLDPLAIAAADASSKKSEGVKLADLASCKRQLFIAISLQVFQQFSGINGVMTYMGDMYSTAGLDASFWSVFLNSTQFVVTLFACLLIDRFGRRVLLTAGASGLSLGLAIMTAVMFCIQGKGMQSEFLKASFAVGSVVFMSAFAIGVGAIPWLILGEIFNDKIRGTAASIASCVNWTGSFIVTITCELMFENLKMYGLMSFYLFFAVAMVVFTLVFVPETKGKSMEEIQANFNKSGKQLSNKHDDVATSA
jgi:sugar porter (SP) family MFS transporter